MVTTSPDAIAACQARIAQLTADMATVRRDRDRLSRRWHDLRLELQAAHIVAQMGGHETAPGLVRAISWMTAIELEAPPRVTTGASVRADKADPGPRTPQAAAGAQSQPTPVVDAGDVPC